MSKEIQDNLNILDKKDDMALSNFDNDTSSDVKEIDVSKLPPRTLVELLTINGQTHLLDAIKKCPEDKRDDFIRQLRDA